MATKLNWIEKNITPLTSAYKNFIAELENTPAEIFYQDGERTFTPSEQKFLEIYDYKTNGFLFEQIDQTKEELKNKAIQDREDRKIQKLISEIIERLEDYKSQGLKHISLTYSNYLINVDDINSNYLKIIPNDTFYLAKDNSDINLLSKRIYDGNPKTKDEISIIDVTNYYSSEIDKLINAFKNEDIFITHFNDVSLDKDESTLLHFLSKLDKSVIMDDSMIQSLKKELEEQNKIFQTQTKSQEEQAISKIIEKLEDFKSQGLENISISNNTYITNNYYDGLGKNELNLNTTFYLSSNKDDISLLDESKNIKEGYSSNENSLDYLVEGTSYNSLKIDELIEQFQSKYIFSDNDIQIDYNKDDLLYFLSKLDQVVVMDKPFIENLKQYHELILDGKIRPELEFGRLASVTVEDKLIKGVITSVSEDQSTVQLKTLSNEEFTLDAKDVYQFFNGQKYDVKEIEPLFDKAIAGGITFEDIKNNKDLIPLLKGELTNTVYSAVSVNQETNETKNYEFKIRPEYNSTKKELELKPYFKNQTLDLSAAKPYGETLTPEQIKDLGEGKKVLLERVNKENEPYTVKVSFDKDLNQFINQKLTKKEYEAFKNKQGKVAKQEVEKPKPKKGKKI